MLFGYIGNTFEIQLLDFKIQQKQVCNKKETINGFLKERVMGIEPTYPAWKAGVLPLNYTRICYYEKT
jgi:hypothetical protein